MIKIWPDSIDANCPKPNGSFLFVKDLCTYDSGNFQQATSIESADCIVFPQYSNYVFAPYKFDKDKIDLFVRLGKPIIMHNDGGAYPLAWKTNIDGSYIWNELAGLIKVFFSVECYGWHRKDMPPKINYVPFDFVGYTEMGVRFIQAPPLQTKDEFLRRQIDTHFCMNVYPPSRDLLWEVVNSASWNTFNLNTNPTYRPFRDRISGEEMLGGLRNSKIGFAPDGATAKTERHLFVPANTVMMKQEDSVEFTYPWVDGENCLEMVHDFQHGYEREKEQEYGVNGHNLRILNKQKTREKIIEWLNKPNELYEIYCNGHENAKKYELANYFKNHIGKTIKENL